jgi:hypothetical protein
MLVAACQAATAPTTPSAAGTPAESVAPPSESAPAPSAAPSLLPTPTGTPLPTASERPTPAVTPVPSSSSGDTSTGAWVAAGSLVDFSPWLAVPLGDGGALAFGQDATVTRRWDPATARWRQAAALNATRQDFAAVPLRDGRILVTGGLDTHNQNRWQAYSSTYVYDLSTTAGSWTKVGLLGTARVAPAAAVLPDGRVLVAGGAYKDGPPFETGSSGITLAASTAIVPAPATGGGGRWYDMAPPSIGVALATAELFDAETGRWSPTGSMRFARARAAAATLSDGRILIVGSSGEQGEARLDPRAYDTAEVYDPATGRFSLVGSLPSIDREAIAADGVEVPDYGTSSTAVGTLVPLPDGGALLVGHGDGWKHAGWVTRTIRFDALSGRWR